MNAAAAPAAEQGVANQSPQGIVSVTGFRPPHEGAVHAIVKLQGEGGQTEQRSAGSAFTRTPNFKAADPSKAQRVGLPLPNELAGSEALKLHVYLVPFKGDGNGAVFELGGAEIR
jgi:hypothetical protein